MMANISGRGGGFWMNGSNSLIDREMGAADSCVITPRFFWAIVGASTLVAFIARWPFFGTPGFPLGEGGLFVLFAEVIRDNGFQLPVYVEYGGVELPFAYPPMAFYLAALIHKATGVGMMSLFYWLPILFNFLAIPAFALLAVHALRDRVAVAGSTICYGAVVHSFLWQITGGGLPRSLAALFALLAVVMAFRCLHSPGWRRPICAGALVGLAILCHLEWGLFSAIGVGLALITSTDLRRGVMVTVGIGATAALIISPWVAAVVLNHGIAPFLSSSAGSEWKVGKAVLEVMAGRFLGIQAWPAALGVFVAVARRQWFAILWVPLTLLVTPRMGASAGVTIPVTLLAGLGISAGSNFVLRMLADNAVAHRTSDPSLLNRDVSGVNGLAIFMTAVMVFLLISPYREGTANITTMNALTSGERKAMLWIRRNAPEKAKFVILSEGQEWWADREAEWFPYLADRASLTTAQGLEWAKSGDFTRKKREILRLKRFERSEPTLMSEMLSWKYCGAYVAIFYGEDYYARISMASSPKYRRIYANRSAAVYEPRTTAGGCRRVNLPSVLD